jgi:hypothetical protein
MLRDRIRVSHHIRFRASRLSVPFGSSPCPPQSPFLGRKIAPQIYHDAARGWPARRPPNTNPSKSILYPASGVFCRICSNRRSVLKGAIDRFNNALQLYKDFLHVLAFAAFVGLSQRLATSRRSFTLCALASINFPMCGFCVPIFALPCVPRGVGTVARGSTHFATQTPKNTTERRSIGRTRTARSGLKMRTEQYGPELPKRMEDCA